MKIKTIKFLSVIAICLSLVSCSKSLYTGNGASDNKPLKFNNEYDTKNLNEIVVDGKAFWGIPSFANNNKNNKNRGFIFNFNGVNLGKTPRLLPIVSLIGYTVFSQQLIQRVSGLGPIPSFFIGVPIAGTLNNLTWSNSALSGCSATLSYRLVQENPDVDVFFYPKYEIQRKNLISDGGVKFKYLWTQEATVKARVSGATLIKNQNK